MPHDATLSDFQAAVEAMRERRPMRVAFPPDGIIPGVRLRTDFYGRALILPDRTELARTAAYCIVRGGPEGFRTSLARIGYEAAQLTIRGDPCTNDPGVALERGVARLGDLLIAEIGGHTHLATLGDPIRFSEFDGQRIVRVGPLSSEAEACLCSYFAAYTLQPPR